MIRTLVLCDESIFIEELCLVVAQSAALKDRLSLKACGLDAEEMPSEATQAELIFVVLPAADDEEHEQRITRLSSLTTARLVVVGRTITAPVLLRFLRAGAHDFLDDTADIQTQLIDTIQRLASKGAEPTPSRHAPLITIVGATGGAGATTVATNLSAMLAKRFQSCGIVDLSFGFGDIAMHFDIEPRHTIRQLCTNFDRLDAEMLQNAITEHSSGVKLIASGIESELFEPPAVEAILRVVQLARDALPCVVADIERSSPCAIDVVKASDATVVLSGLNFPAACATHRLLEYWTACGVNPATLILAGNHARRRNELSTKEVEAICNRPVDCFIADDPQSVNVSANCGIPAVVDLPGGRLSKDVNKLFRLVMSTLDGSGAKDTRASRSTLAGLARIVNMFLL